MELRISFKELEDLELTFTEYLVLWGLYNSVRYGKITIDPVIYENLLAEGYIALEDTKYKLTQEGIEVFEPRSSYFNDFIIIFPTRVSTPSGEVRVLSPASPTTNVGKRMKKKWGTITGRNPLKEQKLIDCLKVEVDLRKRSGTLHFMRNIETWLNKSTWEDYEYLLEKPINNDSSEIKL